MHILSYSSSAKQNFVAQDERRTSRASTTPDLHMTEKYMRHIIQLLTYPSISFGPNLMTLHMFNQFLDHIRWALQDTLIIARKA